MCQLFHDFSDQIVRHDNSSVHMQGLVLAMGPVLDPAGFIDLHGNGLTPSKIDGFLSEPSL